MTTINLKVTNSIINNFSINELEKIINSEDFEDLLLLYHMKQSENQWVMSFVDFKSKIWT